jgi:monoamine oxidase
MSGLVAAWRLAIAGAKVEVFESSGRTGGRMYTLRDFTPEGQFCELGGEFVSTIDAALIRVCGELGVALEPFDADGAAGAPLFDLGGKARTPRDLLDPASQEGPFFPVAARIAADQAALLDSNGNWTARAKELDALPLLKYLEGLSSSTERWVIDLLALAWHSEFGIPVSRQSSLNLVDLIGAETSQGFAMFGKHDGALRIAGGSSRLPEALTTRLSSPPMSDKVDIHLRHQLASLARMRGGIKLSFKTEDGSRVDRTFSRVVMALPFSRLREISGLGGIALPADKMMVINELGYGANAKLAVGTNARPWRDGMAGIEGPLNGTVYTDRGFQLVWETSAGQRGDGGVLTNYLAGDAARGEEARALARLQAGLAALAPDVAGSLTPKVRASLFWSSHPHTRGSYAGCLTGQYTSYPEIAARLELEGMLAFAGEHTSLNAMGSMNGAVDAGERAARDILASLVKAAA